MAFGVLWALQFGLNSICTLVFMVVWNHQHKMSVSHFVFLYIQVNCNKITLANPGGPCRIFFCKEQMPYLSFRNAGLWEIFPPSSPSSTGVYSLPLPPLPPTHTRMLGVAMWLSFMSGIVTDSKAEVWKELVVWLGLLLPFFGKRPWLRSCCSIEDDRHIELSWTQLSPTYIN